MDSVHFDGGNPSFASKCRACGQTRALQQAEKHSKLELGMAAVDNKAWLNKRRN
jgi:hypothetical protein